MQMKKIAIFMLAASLGLIGWAGSSFALTISDGYIGADPTRGYAHVDVIGQNALFDIDRLEVNLIGNQLVVDIYSGYFDNVGAYHTELGDLFLSIDGWNPVYPTLEDSMHNGGETWELVAALGNKGGSSGNASLYRLDPTNTAQYESDILTSDEKTDGSRYIYRGDQEVQYNQIGGQGVLLTDEGSWYISDEMDFLRISVQALAGPDFDLTDIKSLGYHYAMTCGNDVIEGSAPVPEPGTVFLLGVGLIALATRGRRRTKP
jgi:hypothetical protein